MIHIVKIYSSQTKAYSRVPILEIPNNINYWFVRANGGKYYRDFLEHQYIGTADNNIKFSDLEQLSENDDNPEHMKTVENVKTIYMQKYPHTKKQLITLYSKRLYNFTFDMKDGDIVIVPGQHSDVFAIGVLMGKPYDESPENIGDIISHSDTFNYKTSNYQKRRHVFWIREIRRQDLPEKMYWVLSAHQSFFDIKQHRDGLNHLISPIYLADGQVHLNLHIGTKNDLSFDNWSSLQTMLKASVKEHSKEFNMRPDVQSPGDIHIDSSSININDIVEICKMFYHLVEPFGIHHPVATASIIFSKPVLNLIFGKNIFKTGIIDYCLTEWDKLEDIRAKRIATKKAKKAFSDAAKEKETTQNMEIKNVDNDGLSNEVKQDIVNMKPSITTIGHIVKNQHVIQDASKKAVQKNQKQTDTKDDQN